MAHLVIPCNFTVIGYYDRETGLVNVYDKNGGGFYNVSTHQLVIPCIYETYGAFSEGLKAVMKAQKCGFVNMENDVIVPFVYDYATDFSEGFAVVKRYGKYGYIDRCGKDTFI